MGVSPITNPTVPSLSPAAPTSKTTNTANFGKVISDQLGKLDSQQHVADAAVRKFMTGKSDNVHDVVLSMAKADLAFRFLLEVRNRLVDSYQELMRMQV